MLRSILSCLVPIALSACSMVLSLTPAVADDQAVLDERLLGEWWLVMDDDTTRVTVTRSDRTTYAVRFDTGDDDPGYYLGRLGPLDGDRWVLELTADVAKIPAAASYDPALVPTRMPYLVNRGGRDLAIGVFNVDTLLAAIARGTIAPKPAWVEHDDHLILTTDDGGEVRSLLRQLARMPGGVVMFTRQGRTFHMPEELLDLSGP